MTDPLAPEASGDALKPGGWIGADIDPNNPVLPGPCSGRRGCRHSRRRASRCANISCRRKVCAIPIRRKRAPPMMKRLSVCTRLAVGASLLFRVPRCSLTPTNVGPKERLAALRFIKPGGAARAAAPVADGLGQKPVGAGERAITEALDRFSKSGRGNAWVSVPEGGQGIYMRLNLGGIEIANLDFGQKGTGAFARYLDHIEAED
jgi:hypothetical protein